MSEINKNNEDQEIEQSADVTSASEALSSTAPNDSKAPKWLCSFTHALLEQLDLFVIIFALLVIATSCLFRVCTVDGDSMKDTLHNKDSLIVSDLFYTPQRGDIVVFHQTGQKISDYNEPIVKRVIAVAGDTVKIRHLRDTMIVTVTDKDGNSKVLKEDYIRYDYASYKDMEVYVTEGTVFVMGDNRSHSADSRAANIGLVDTRRILGKVVLRIGGSGFGTVE